MSSELKILIVDDKPANLLVLKGILDQPHLNILEASSGNEALGIMLEHDFALVLLDVQMPEMDGFEVAEIMRGNERTQNIPIIFVTAISKEKQHIFRGYDSGAVDYLLKPIEPMILKSKVDIFCTLHRQKELLQQQITEIEEKNTLLTKQFEEIKILRGFLPICSNCKKIRDDTGYWTAIEVYIRDRSEAEFSHGICPDCAKVLYPGIDIFSDK